MYWKTQQLSQDWKRSTFIPLLKKGNAKECSNHHAITLISHSSKIILKILQPKLQQYMNPELPDVQAGFRKCRELEIKLPTSAGSLKKRIPEKYLFLLYWLCQSLWLCGSQQTGKFFKRWEYWTTWPASWETYMQVRKQQLEWTWNNRLVPNRRRSTSRLYIVTLLI